MKITKFSTCQDLYYGIQWSLKRSAQQIWGIWGSLFQMKAQAQCVGCLIDYYSLHKFRCLSELSEMDRVGYVKHHKFSQSDWAVESEFLVS